MVKPIKLSAFQKMELQFLSRLEPTVKTECLNLVHAAVL